jgi:hypothetical protein
MGYFWWPKSYRMRFWERDVCGRNGKRQGANMGWWKEVDSRVRRRRCRAEVQNPLKWIRRFFLRFVRLPTLFLFFLRDSKFSVTLRILLTLPFILAPYIKLPVTGWTRGFRFPRDSRIHSYRVHSIDYVASNGRSVKLISVLCLVPKCSIRDAL